MTVSAEEFVQLLEEWAAELLRVQELHKAERDRIAEQYRDRLRGSGFDRTFISDFLRDWHALQEQEGREREQIDAPYREKFRHLQREAC